MMNFKISGSLSNKKEVWPSLSDQELWIQTMKWFVLIKFSVTNDPTGKIEVYLL